MEIWEFDCQNLYYNFQIKITYFWNKNFELSYFFYSQYNIINILFNQIIRSETLILAFIFRPFYMASLYIYIYAIRHIIIHLQVLDFPERTLCNRELRLSYKKKERKTYLTNVQIFVRRRMPPISRAASNGILSPRHLPRFMIKHSYD